MDLEPRSLASSSVARIVSSSFRIVLVTILLLSAVADAAPLERQKSGKFSVFSLFNLKGKSKFWSESVIRGEFDSLEASVSSDSGKAAMFNYTTAGNIASYLKLSEVESIYIPVPVNFIFIGFEGKGNHDFKLSPEELERWFTKIDHIFEHTRIPPIGEVLTPFYKISIDKVQHHHLPLVSHINYNFSVHAIHMGEQVTSVIEYAIKVLSRKEDFLDSRDDGEVLWQVDLDRMEYVFSALIEQLQIGNTYNIFIVNPKHNGKKVHYGYRRGLSEPEINFLKENKTLQTKILQSEKAAQVPLDIDKSKEWNPLYVNRPMSSFAWTATEDTHTVEWSKKCIDALSSVEKSNEGKGDDELIYSKAVQMLHGKKDGINLLLEKELKSGELKGLHPECLSDTWIGRDRWAFIDLSAGPFSWGPSVGGEGVRTDLGVPNVGKTIGVAAELTEDEAEDEFQDAIREKFSAFGDDHEAIDILMAEIDIYEIFAFKHCKGRKIKLALCDELEERMRDLKGELEEYNSEEYSDAHKKKAIDALKRIENWNLFSVSNEDHHGRYSVARDSFLAHLGATLWGSMRHIIAPSVADGAYHYYEKVSFQMYFITQEKIRNIKQLPVDLKSLKEALSLLLLSSQEVMFSEHLLPLSEEPALTMAFSVARRAAAVPLLLVNGTYRSTVRTYLDSSILQHQLQRLNGQGSLKGHQKVRSTLEVPIFWFIHSDPLLVDKHYQAKALSDMIIVVQSEASSWESHLQCNGKSLLLDLRRPMKAVVAATAEHLAGLLPLHLVYSHAHETAVEDWTWSVGCNPLSITSHGWHLSQFQSDVIARNYIITALEESIQLVNTAIYRLIAERTTPQGFKLFKTQERAMVEKYNFVVNLWRRISTMSGGLRYGDAVKILSSLEEASAGFSDIVNSTITSLHPIHCTRERKVDIELDLTTIPAFLVVFAILWFVLRPRRPKPKIN